MKGRHLLAAMLIAVGTLIGMAYLCHVCGGAYSDLNLLARALPVAAGILYIVMTEDRSCPPKQSQWW